MAGVSTRSRLATEKEAEDPIMRMCMTNMRTLELMFAIQYLFLDEFAFASSQLLDRVWTETHLLAQLVSKAAESHSVRDLSTMWEECGHHQLEFMRRDYDRVFKHADRMVEKTSKLVLAREVGD